MLAIGGLGNPEGKYEQTRHNVGYLVLDHLASKLGSQWERKPDLKSLVIKEKGHMLFKPLTYVNLSGEATSCLLDFYKISTNELWVVHDDTEIPFGEVRVKFGGTSGGHNGVKSIDEAVGSDYWRIRVGVGRPSNPSYELADYVLSNFTQTEQKELSHIVDRVTSFLVQSIKDQQLTAITFNAKEK